MSGVSVIGVDVSGGGCEWGWVQVEMGGGGGE